MHLFLEHRANTHSTSRQEEPSLIHRGNPMVQRYKLFRHETINKRVRLPEPLQMVTSMLYTVDQSLLASFFLAPPPPPRSSSSIFCGLLFLNCSSSCCLDSSSMPLSIFGKKNAIATLANIIQVIGLYSGPRMAAHGSRLCDNYGNSIQAATTHVKLVQGHHRALDTSRIGSPRSRSTPNAL